MENSVVIPEGRTFPIVTDRAALKVKPVDFDFRSPPMDPLQLGADLVKNMVDSGGIGLSAIQIGLPYRVFSIRTSPQHTVLFNPKIVKVDEFAGEEVMEEGCLSFPNYIIKVKRWKAIHVRFWFPNGEFQTQRYEGMTARVVQHEIDHCDGVVFQDRATLFHKEQADRKFLKRQKAMKQLAAQAKEQATFADDLNSIRAEAKKLGVTVLDER